MKNLISFFITFLIGILFTDLITCQNGEFEYDTEIDIVNKVPPAIEHISIPSTTTTPITPTTTKRPINIRKNEFLDKSENQGVKNLYYKKPLPQKRQNVITATSPRSIRESADENVYQASSRDENDYYSRRLARFLFHQRVGK